MPYPIQEGGTLFAQVCARGKKGDIQIIVLSIFVDVPFFPPLFPGRQSWYRIKTMIPGQLTSMP